MLRRAAPPFPPPQAIVREAAAGAVKDAMQRGAKEALTVRVCVGGGRVRMLVPGGFQRPAHRHKNTVPHRHTCAHTRAHARPQEAASKGVSEEERAARVAAEKEQRMQDIIRALTVLASSSGARVCVCVCVCVWLAFMWCVYVCAGRCALVCLCVVVPRGDAYTAG